MGAAVLTAHRCCRWFRWRKGSIALSCQQQNKQQVKLEQGKYSYTKRKKPVIYSKCDRQWPPVAKEALTVRQHHPRETLPSLPGRMEPRHCSLLLAGEISHTRPSLLWDGCSAVPATPESTESWVQCLENFIPFFKVAENQGKALACFWHSFEGNWCFEGMAICKELTPRQAAVWISDGNKPCQRLSYQGKPFQKTNDQPADYYPWQYCRTSMQRFSRGLRSKPGSDKLHKSKHLANSYPCT